MTGPGDAGHGLDPWRRIATWRADRRSRRALDLARRDRVDGGSASTKRTRASTSTKPGRGASGAAPDASVPRPHRRNAAKVGAAFAAVVVIMLLFLGPGSIGVFNSQRSQTAALNDKIATLDEANASLAKQATELHDPQAIRELARRNYGMVPKGSKSYAILPSPSSSSDLEGTWPFVELTPRAEPAAPDTKSDSASTP